MTRATQEKSSCRGCGASVRVPAHEIERILAEYLRDHPQELAGDAVYQARLESCGTCDDLHYGTTCCHCGCLVAVRARLAEKQCPNPGGSRW